MKKEIGVAEDDQEKNTSKGHRFQLKEQEHQREAGYIGCRALAQSSNFQRKPYLTKTEYLTL